MTGCAVSCAQPIHLGSATIDIAEQRHAFYYFLLFVFAVAVGLMAFMLRIAVRPHVARDPRE